MDVNGAGCKERCRGRHGHEDPEINLGGKKVDADIFLGKEDF